MDFFTLHSGACDPGVNWSHMTSASTCFTGGLLHIAIGRYSPQVKSAVGSVHSNISVIFDQCLLYCKLVHLPVPE